MPPHLTATPLRVLFINRQALPSMGGKQTYTDRLVRGLCDAGVEVTVVATWTVGADPPLDAPYRTVYRPGWRTLWRCVRDADVVHFNAFTWIPWCFSRLQRRPIVFVYHETADRLCARAMGWRFWERRCRYHPGVPCLWCGQTSILRQPRHWLQKPIQQLVTGRADVVVSPVRWWLDRLPTRTRYLPHGIDMTLFRPAERPSRDFLFFIGRLVEDKGPETLLRAVAECAARGHTIRLALAGEGDQKPALEAIARELLPAGQVEFLGLVSDEEAVRLLQNAAAVIVPSTWEEMFGLVAVEAMACRTPTIASALGGLNETAGQAGLVFPPGDVDALTERILQVWNDPAFAEELAERGLRFVAENHEHGAMVGAYRALYLELARPLPGATNRSGPTKVAGRNSPEAAGRD